MELIEYIKNVFAIGALACVSYLSVTASIAVHTLEEHTSQAIMNVNDAVVQVNKTLATVNNKGGTLQQMDETVVRVKDLITLTQATLNKQQKSIDAFDVNLATTLANVNIALNGITEDSSAVSHQAVSTLAVTSQALSGLQTDEASANVAIVQFTSQMDALQPVVLSTLNNTNDTMDNVAASTTDVKNFIHKETTPKKLTFWGGMEAGAVWAHKILMPSIF
jgi:hypothetical protein